MRRKIVRVFCDLFDPSRSSEFAVPLKLLPVILEHFDIELTTFRRRDNVSEIRTWAERNGYVDRVKLITIPLRFANFDGHHRFKWLFFLDCIVAQIMYLIQHRRDDTPILKVGAVHFAFNLAFLFRSRPVVIGPVSGFEVFPLRMARQWLSVRWKLYYVIFNVFTIVLRRLFRVMFIINRQALVLCATARDSKYMTGNRSDLAMRCLQLSEVVLDTFVTVQPKAITGQRIVWAGAMIPRKNPILAFNVAAEICKSNRRASVVFLGTGPLFETLQARHAELGPELRNRILLRGDICHRSAITEIALADVILVTSWREVNSFVVFEALASGVPVVSLPFSGMEQIVGEFGKLVEIGLPGTLEEKVLAAIYAVLDDIEDYRTKARSFRDVLVSREGKTTSAFMALLR